MIVINSFDDLEQLVGKELGISQYITISQEKINQFAQATLDHQWIHTNVERARTESPFKSTIAHGYMTLSIIPYLLGNILEIRNVKLIVNYGIESLRFKQPVLVDSLVRLRARLISAKNLKGITKAKIHVSLEIMENTKTAFDATLVYLYHF